MKQEKAFTLVELLAVIVILAIVLIIAVPGVLGIINKTKNNAYESQLKMIKEAAKNYIVEAGDQVAWKENQTVVSLIDMQTRGLLDKKIIDPRDKSEMKHLAVVITRHDKQMKYDIVYTDASDANYPRLSHNMIPIRYDGTKWLKADASNQDQSWFDYSKQQWANIATVTEDVRQSLLDAPVGTEVPMDKINTMFVWIPRYKYKLFNVDGTVSPVGNPNLAGDYMIDITMESQSISKSTGSQNGQWLTHPAFTFGGQELEGFWMAKFETGYAGATTTTEAEQNVLDPTKILVKPDIYSWRGINLNNSYQMVQAMSQDVKLFGITNANDPHLVKNMEWGAMVYLASSSYGKAGNPDYSISEKQVRINNNSDYLTGCGANTQDATPSTTCNSYNTANGMSASTTGNITGIYDTAGGAWDTTFAVLERPNGLSYVPALTGITEETLAELVAENKYIEAYKYNDTWADRSRGRLGEATIEMGPYDSDPTNDRSSWYGDYARFVAYPYTLMYRGGSQINDPSGLGISAFYAYSGQATYNATFRIIMI